jgi:hypothetical protein
MSTDITMQELELESAELLPSRETLWSWGRSNTYVSQFGQGNVIGSGNYDQHGAINVQADNDNVLFL